MVISQTITPYPVNIFLANTHDNSVVGEGSFCDVGWRVFADTAPCLQVTHSVLRMRSDP